MFHIYYTKEFKKNVKLCKKRGLDLSLLEDIISILQKEGKLPAKYKPHTLKGKYNGLWECHILPDWLLIWEQDNTDLTLLLLNTGSHSDLF